MARMLLAGISCAVAAATLLSCINDPVRNTREEAFGDDFSEPKGFEGSAYHRPGQPCVDCHSKRGGNSPSFSVAGTVFWGTCNVLKEEEGNAQVVEAKCNRVGVRDAEVRFVFGSGGTKCVVTNCAGNFFLPETEVDFPFLVSVSKRTPNGTIYESKMTGHVSRDGSCAGCHDNPRREDSPGQVYLFGEDAKGNVGVTGPARDLMRSEAGQPCAPPSSEVRRCSE
jgi:hypothetical protein